ncbi:IclR family transcriptional regulator [Breoghania sp.]|uniref:IclR family transcriptional regulator n=1 Tax=Breoghania sp. TaxID=2065378 RepID=UPI0029CA686E|nr:IclR family transcriptional regulator [Breoghania sp.]
MSASERVLDALIAVAGAPRPMTAAQLAETLDVPLSSAYRHIALLKKYDLIVDLGRDAGLVPGPACWRLGQAMDNMEMVASLARPVMLELSRVTQESVGLMQAVAAEVFCADMIESSLSLRCSFAKGRAQPLNKGASAKLLLAYMSENTRRLALQGLPRGPEYEALEAELATIRSQGYAVSESEVDFGVWGVSAPVFGPGQRLVCGLTLMVPVIRVGDRLNEFVSATVKAAADISLLLAGSSDQ